MSAHAVTSHHSHRRAGGGVRTALLTSAAVLLGVVCPLVAAQTAAAKCKPTPTGKATISGKVTNAATARGVGSVIATAYLKTADQSRPGAYLYTRATSAVTTRAGTYKLDKLAAGTYHIEFVPPAASGLARQTWSGAGTLKLGDDIVLGEKTKRSGVDAALTAGQKISGTVVNGANTGVQGVAVTVFRQHDDPVWTVLRDYEAVATATTALSGAYGFAALPAGVYHLEFRPADLLTYAIEAWDDKCALANGDDIDLTAAAAVSGLVTVLDAPGTLEGTVADAVSGDPLAGMRVHICYQTPGRVENLGDVVTDANGHYVQHGLKQFPFFPWAEDPQGWHTGAWVYPNGDAMDPGSDEAIQPGETKVVDVQLGRAGGLTGRVLDSAGAAVAGVSVSAYAYVDYGEEGAYWERVSDLIQTDANGRYTIEGLAEGSIYLMFTDPPQWRYARTCLGGTAVVSQSDPVPVVYHELTDAPDVTLSTERGSLAGTVTDGHGAVPEGPCDVTVRAWDPNDEYAASPVAVEWTSADGTYRIDGLPYGEYRVIFNNQSGLPNLRMTYDGDFFDVNPTMVTVGADPGTSNHIDASLPLPSKITGTVTGDAGDGVQPQPGIQVMVDIDMGDGAWSDVAWTETDENGFYEASVPAGNYRVRFEDQNGNWVQQAYPGVPDVSQGTTVAVGFESTTGGIDAVLAPAGHIVGHLLIPAGADYTLNDVWISAVPIVGGLFGSALPAVQADVGSGLETDAWFDLGGLPLGGNYVLQYDDGSGNVYEYYDDHTVWANATFIYVDENGQWLASNHSQAVSIEDEVIRATLP